MSSWSNTKPTNPPKGSKFGVRPSPRKGSKYVPSRPDVPFQASVASSFEVEFDQSYSVLRTTRVTDVNRHEVKSLEAQTDSELHALFEREQRGEMAPFVRYVEQIKVLENSMRDITGMVRKHCSDQAALLDKIWSSAADLFSAVCKSLSDKVQDLEHKLTEKTHQAKRWQGKAQHYKFRFQEMAQSASTSMRSAVDPSHLRQLEEEILLKDRELMRLQQMSVNLSIWFPSFYKFSDSVLSRFLPPVDEEEEPEEEDEDTPAPAPVGMLQKQKSKIVRDIIDPQIKEVNKIIRSRQLAQDHLLKDLKRLEHLGIGLQVFLGDVPSQDAFSPVMKSTTNSPALKGANPLRTSVTQGHNVDEVNALNMGLFNTPQIASSFSATNGLEYMLKAPTNSFAHLHGQQGKSTSISEMSHDMIAQAAQNVASVYQSALQSTVGHKKQKKPKRKQMPTPVPDSPVKTPMLTMQEFYRLQGRKFSTMTNMPSDFYKQDAYNKNKVSFSEATAELAGDQEGILRINTDLADVPEEGLEDGGLNPDTFSDGGGDDEDDSDEDDDSVRARLKECLEQLQAVEVMKNKEIQQRELDVVYYEDTINQLKLKQSLLKQELRRVSESSNTMTKALPSRYYMSIPLSSMHVKLRGTMIIRPADHQFNAMSHSIVKDALPQLSFAELEQQINTFYQRYISSPNSADNSSQSKDDIVDSWHDEYLSNLLNGQSLHSLNVPLLGISVLLTETREKKCIYSLISSHMFESLQRTEKAEHRQTLPAKDALKGMLQSLVTIIMQNNDLPVDIDSLQSSEINAEVYNAFLSKFTPAAALLFVFRMLWGVNQLRAFSVEPDADDDHRNLKSAPSFQTLLRAKISIARRDARPAATSSLLENSALAVEAQPANIIGELDGIGEEDSWADCSEFPIDSSVQLDYFLNSLGNAQPEPEAPASTIRYLTVSPRGQSYSDDEEDSSLSISTQAVQSIECFDLYLQCLRSLQAFVCSGSLTEALVPITSTDTVIRRIFRVLSVPEGIDGLQKATGNKLKTKAADEASNIVPWWRFITAETMALLKLRLHRHAQIRTIDPELVDEIDGNVHKSTPCVPAAYYFYYSLKAMSTTRTALCSILKNMHNFLKSLLPEGPQDNMYPVLLSYMLLCSPLLAHHARPVESLNVEEVDGGASPTRESAKLHPFTCTVPLSLVHELRMLHSNESLSDEAFAETVLRSGIPNLVTNLSPLLLPLTPKSKQSHSKDMRKPGTQADGALDDLSHSQALTNMSQLAHTVDITMADVVEDDVNEVEDVKRAARDVVKKLGLCYHTIIDAVMRSIDAEGKEVVHTSKHVRKLEAQQAISHFSESVNLHRFLFPKPGMNRQDDGSGNEVADEPKPLSACSEYLRRLVAHTRLSFEPNLQKAVAASFSHRYFTLIALLHTFGHVRHGQLLSLATSSDISVEDFTSHNKNAILGLWPSLTSEWESVDARLQQKTRTAKAHYQCKLLRRVLAGWATLQAFNRNGL